MIRSVYAWDLDAPYNPDAMEWIRYQYDLKQSGCYNCTDEEITPQCSDEIDNDGDGLTDYPDDLDCESEEDRSEFLLVVESQSKIINNEDFDVVGDLIMALQKDDEGVWNDEVTVVDNVEVIIRSGGWIDLGNGEDNEGNQVFNGWNNLEVSAENAGFYRIYINLEFEDTGEIVEGSWEFEVV